MDFFGFTWLYACLLFSFKFDLSSSVKRPFNAAEFGSFMNLIGFSASQVEISDNKGSEISICNVTSFFVCNAGPGFLCLKLCLSITM